MILFKKFKMNVTWWDNPIFYIKLHQPFTAATVAKNKELTTDFLFIRINL